MRTTLTNSYLELVSNRLHAIAEPTRIRILTLLEQRDATVQDITDELTTTHQNVSKHLGVLYRAGIVARRKDGHTVVYSLSDYSACQLIEKARASVTGYVEELVAITGLDAS